MMVPDWSRMESYSEIYGLVARAAFPTPADFIEGPFERLLQLAAANPGRPGARIMEFARASLSRFKDREAAVGRPTSHLEAMAAEKVRCRFGLAEPNDQYMLAVFEVRANHNGAYSDED